MNPNPNFKTQIPATVTATAGEAKTLSFLFETQKEYLIHTKKDFFSLNLTKPKAKPFFFTDLKQSFKSLFNTIFKTLFLFEDQWKRKTKKEKQPAPTKENRLSDSKAVIFMCCWHCTRRGGPLSSFDFVGSVRKKGRED